MVELIYIIITCLIISLVALIGIITLAVKEKVLNEILLLLVGFSAGTLIGGAFLHLLHESIEISGEIDIFPYVIIGIVLFFIVEKVLHWRHCHKGTPHAHTFHYMNLIWDSVHNFIDGMIMAASFVISIPLGLATFIAVAAHEIPQEIGDFEKKKALFLNFLVALTVVIGGIIGYFISKSVENATVFLPPFAAGGFIYIAATDLIPEIRKEIDIRKSIIILEVFILGILIMWILRIAFRH